MEIYERDLSFAEQLERARNRIAQLTAREAELVAEVAKYREALIEITGDQGELPWGLAACRNIARNALKED